MLGAVFQWYRHENIVVWFFAASVWKVKHWPFIRIESTRIIHACYKFNYIHRLKIANKNVAPKYVSVWSSGLTSSSCLSNHNWAVQVWGASSWQENYDLIANGFNVVMSHVNAWYLDCGFGSWRTTGNWQLLPMAAVMRHDVWNITLYISLCRVWCMRSIHNMAQSIQTSSMGRNALGVVQSEAGMWFFFLLDYHHMKQELIAQDYNATYF